MANTVRVWSDPHGSLVSSNLNRTSGQPVHWREVGPLVFRDVEGQERIAFQRSGSGGMTMVASPTAVFHRIPWTGKVRVNLWILYYSLGMIVLSLLLWPVAAAARR